MVKQFRFGFGSQYPAARGMAQPTHAGMLARAFAARWGIGLGKSGMKRRKPGAGTRLWQARSRRLCTNLEG